MSTTIRIADEDKDRLRNLQEMWRKTRGEATSQQELVSLGLAYLQRHWEDFVQESAWRPRTPKEVRALEKDLVGPWSDGSPYDVDEILYGWKK